MDFLLQLWPIWVCLLVGIAGLALGVRQGRPTRSDVFSKVADGVREYLLERRMQRDPEFKKTIECLSRYDAAFAGLRWAMAHLHKLDRKIEETVPSEDRPIARGTVAYQIALDLLASARDQAAAYFASQTDEEIAILAKAHSQDFEGRLPVEVAEGFLRREREAARAAPIAVMRHLERRVEAYSPYFEVQDRSP